MIQIERLGNRLVFGVSLICLAVLLCGVIWASGRSFEMTDESYYLLSAIHPNAVQAYVSAQHWTLAPLWQLTGSLTAFRLIGAFVLIASACLLALSTMQMFLKEVGQAFSWRKALPVVATSCVCALLYVATIQPSPSYNLLAAAGAYAAGGATLLAVNHKNNQYAFLYCIIAGFFIAIGFVNKPSAGVSSAMVAMAWILFLMPGLKKWICLGLLPVSGALTVLGMAFMQETDPGVLQSLQNGLALFRQVQTEPVGERLIRYAVTLMASIGKTIVIFAPALALVVGALIFQRIWVAILALVGFVIIILVEKSFLGGMHQYHLQLEAIYALMLALIMTGFANIRHRLKSPLQIRIPLLFLGLTILPFSVAVGTGNALFTQIIVSLAPWGVLMAMGTFHFKQDNHVTTLVLRQGLQIALLILITAQILTSYTRDPYHLALPLTGQNTLAQIGDIGEIKTDPATAQMVSDLEAIKQTCQIKPGSPYFGLYNTTGLALLLNAIPPVSPWINNAQQVEFILDLWSMPKDKHSVILAISLQPDGTPYPLPKRLERAVATSTLCGTIVLPFNQQTVDIRTISKL